MSEPEHGEVVVQAKVFVQDKGDGTADIHIDCAYGQKGLHPIHAAEALGHAMSLLVEQYIKNSVEQGGFPFIIHEQLKNRALAHFSARFTERYLELIKKLEAKYDGKEEG